MSRGIVSLKTVWVTLEQESNPDGRTSCRFMIILRYHLSECRKRAYNLSSKHLAVQVSDPSLDRADISTLRETIKEPGRGPRDT
ncbi:hypothetical protein BPAE_0127g00070 [Botrytis paeoniae]|uniref:Uncharacterized protein n=1 Tax=Botrytis paeoniae TaxID=278948 RepID=A0A4Z1FPF8_9HELO|nr:hypothetical protein BPAE_0127g00070 [Botrytis paeoniae]